MDALVIFFILVAAFVVVSLVYLDIIATLVIFKFPDSTLGMKLLRSLFVWLIPVIGFAFTLRFTQQTFECDLHYKFVPKIVRDWIYDDRYVPHNKLADYRWGKAFWLNVSNNIDSWRDKF